MFTVSNNDTKVTLRVLKIVFTVNFLTHFAQQSEKFIDNFELVFACSKCIWGFFENFSIG